MCKLITQFGRKLVLNKNNNWNLKKGSQVLLGKYFSTLMFGLLWTFTIYNRFTPNLKGSSFYLWCFYLKPFDDNFPNISISHLSLKPNGVELTQYFLRISTHSTLHFIKNKIRRNNFSKHFHFINSITIFNPIFSLLWILLSPNLLPFFTVHQTFSSKYYFPFSQHDIFSMKSKTFKKS